MEKRERLLALSVIILALTILVSAYLIGKSFERGFIANSRGIFEATDKIERYLRYNNTSQNDVLNQAQAASYLQITQEQLLRNLDTIPHVQIDDQNIFSKNALTEWVQKSKISE